MRKGWSLVGIAIVFLTILVVFCEAKMEKNYIEKKFDEGYEEVSVVIEKNNANGIKKFGATTEEDFIIKKIDFEEYVRLKKDDSIKISYDFKLKKMLQESVFIVNANDTWALKSDSINLTGISQSVCVIDTGVNYSHPDFGGCTSLGVGENCRVVGGWDFGNNDNDPMDYDGHGTHVAGIIAANGGISGVAPNSNIVAIKVFSNSDSSLLSWLINGINWCVQNSSTFNISVISISLGITDEDDSLLYSDYCDDESDFFGLRNVIDSASAKNISVVVSSGNDANYTHIGMPACFQNATPVGMTYDKNLGGISWGSPTICTDSSTAIDKISCASNRNWMMTLLAPGAMINSTYQPSLYEALGGTSMSAPHVSGSIAIINQYLKSVGKTKTSSEIENILFNTGTKIIDPENESQNFSRIDVYSALLFMDETNPEVNLISPNDNAINLDANQTFACNATDWQLKNLTFYIWNSSGIYYNETKEISGIRNESEFNLTNMPFGEYEWNCFVNDENNNLEFYASNYSLFISGVFLEISPMNETFTNIDETAFYCNATTSENKELKNMTFYIYENFSLLNYSVVNLSGVSNSSIFYYNLTNETEYLWGCIVYSNESDYDSENYTLIYDATLPEMISISESVTTNSATIIWITNEQTNYSISLNDLTNESFSENFSLIISGLSASTTYNYNLTFCDRAGNCNVSERSLRTSDVSIVTSSSGGGGGGGGKSAITLNELQLSSGVSQIIPVGGKVNLNLNNETHSITLNKIINNSANITVRSEPINFILEVGKEKKINLTSETHYDLAIKLENYDGNFANITLKKINERIIEYGLIKHDGEDDEKEYKIYDERNDSSFDFRKFSFFKTILVIVVLLVLLKFIFGRKKANTPLNKKASKKKKK